MLGPFKRLLKATFNCIQNKVKKPPGVMLESVEKLTKTKILVSV